MLVLERDAHLRQRLLGLAGSLGRLGDAPGKALQGHVHGALLDTGELGRVTQFLQGLDADADLVGRLAHRVSGADRPVDQGGQTADCGDAGKRATEGPHADPQRLGPVGQIGETPRCRGARPINLLERPLSALTDGDQLGLDLAAALDCQADRIGVLGLGHQSVSLSLKASTSPASAACSSSETTPGSQPRASAISRAVLNSRPMTWPEGAKRN